MIQMITGTENFDKALEKGDMIAGFSAPWCGYCRRLETAFRAQGVEYTTIDIEEDPAAAKFVASVNGGNQTVPTMRFPDGSTLTNPSLREVKAKLEKVMK